MTDWWKPNEIRYTREQCIFIVVELVIGKVVTWPTNPAGTGYTDAQWSKKSKRRPGAYYETACQVRAEVEVRLKRTNTDGKLLVSEIKAGEEYLSDESKNALNYISGWRRRRMPYLSWLRQRRYRGRR